MGQSKEPMVIDYNDKMDTIFITVDRKTTPRLFESEVRYMMEAFNTTREEAEKICEERENWKIGLSLIMENYTVFAIESEVLYHEECKKRSPYSGRRILLTFDGIKRYY
jgi:hypothetical protein